MVSAMDIIGLPDAQWPNGLSTYFVLYFGDGIDISIYEAEDGVSLSRVLRRCDYIQRMRK